jgi:hypothetical protein
MNLPASHMDHLAPSKDSSGNGTAGFYSLVTIERDSDMTSYMP